jgi:TnpA family transposase
MMNAPNREVQEILDLQERIGQRLHELQFVDQEAQGAIIHHLAEVAVLGRKLADNSLQQFLRLPAEQGEQLADLVVDIQTDLEEIKEAILDMEAGLLKLVNFLNS